jgi:hypothetical protein
MPLAVSVSTKRCASRVRSPWLTIAALVLAGVLGLAPVAGADSQTFNHTGAVQTFTVPAGLTQVTIDARGAAGGASFGRAGGAGARLVATFVVSPGETLNIVVGGVGGTSNAGGGGGGSFVYRTADAAGLLLAAAGGGGASPGSAGVAGSATCPSPEPRPTRLADLRDLGE